jgi:AraC-like DNA-binding protein
MAVELVLKKTDTGEPAAAWSRVAFASAEGSSDLAFGFAEHAVQPALAHAEGASAPTLVYTERAVQPALAEHVVCTWVEPRREGRHPVLPDACIDLVWDGATLFVAGPDTHAVAITSQASFVGIRFRPGSAPRFLRVGAHELLDQTVPLTELWGRSADLLGEQLADAPPSAANVLERALLERQATLWPADTLVTQVVHDLGRGRTQPEPMHLLARRLGVNERTLRRRCTDALGYGPKTLDRILRFRRALRLMRAHVPLAEAAHQAGYADQSYLSNECRRLANATPGELATGPFTISGNGCN